MASRGFRIGHVRKVRIFGDPGSYSVSGQAATLTYVPVEVAGDAPTITVQTVTPETLVMFDSWHTSSRYERYQRLTVLSETTETLLFHKQDSGGNFLGMAGDSYTLLIDGESVTANDAFFGTVTKSRSSFTISLGALSEGWHKFEIVCPAPETSPVHYMYVSKGGALVQDVTPATHGSFEIFHDHLPHAYVLVPSNAGSPTPRPLTPRTCPTISTAVNRSTLFLEVLVPNNLFPRRQNINADGLKSTYNKQNYFFSDLVDKYPSMHLLDGARGVGTLLMPTHIMIDRHGGAYCCDPWRVVRVTPTGEITTRAGYRHLTPPSNHGETVAERMIVGPPPNPELVGDWSAIPTERQGFHEMWGLAFDVNSLSLVGTGDTFVNPVSGESELPHVSGPRLFVTDTQNNRVCLLTFQRDSFTAEPVITEFLTGLNDPWDVVWLDNKIYVSERKDDRVVEYDAITGAFLRVVISGNSAGLAQINTVDREPTNFVDPLTIRSVVPGVILPEGLFIQDGWLYVGSVSMGCVKRVHLTNGTIEFVCRTPTDLNSNFAKIALSDGTFGPRGTVFVWSWSIARFGMPSAFVPTSGVYADEPGVTYTNQVAWSINTSGLSSVQRGKGGNWMSLGYPSAGGVGLGRMITGSSQEGLAQISAALTGEVAPTSAQLTAYNAGRDEWESLGYPLLHGPAGFGYYSYDLPWGVSSNIDTYLTLNGHTPP
jgi:hypothetical protein